MSIPKLLTGNELAEEFRLHPATLRRLVRENKAPPSVMVGGKRLFPADALARWIEANTARSGRSAAA